MMEETTEQFNLLMKQNQKLWADIFATNNDSSKAEAKTVKDTLVKEPFATDLKKRSTFSEPNHKL